MHLVVFLSIFYCFMSRFLCQTALLSGHLRIFVGVTTNIFSGDDFIPDTRRCITAIDVIEMITIAAEGISQFRLARQLDGSATRN